MPAPRHHNRSSSNHAQTLPRSRLSHRLIELPAKAASPAFDWPAARRDRDDRALPPTASPEGPPANPEPSPLIRTRREQTASTPLPLPPVVLKHRDSSKPSQAKTTLRAARRPKGLDDRLSLQAGDATARGFCGRPSHALRHSGRDKCTGHRGPDVRQPPIPILSPSHPLGVHHRHQLLGEHGLRRHQMIRTRPETRPQRHGHGYDTTRRKIRVEP